MSRAPLTSKLKIYHPNGIKIDVKAFVQESDGTTAWNAHCGRIALRKCFPQHFALVPMEFHGIEVMVPDCAKTFLEWQYGEGWRTPDPGYHMKTSGPLHGAEHLAFISAAGPQALLRRVMLGQASKPAAMARSMAHLFPQERLWPRLAAALESVNPSRRSEDPPAAESAR